MPTAAAWRCTHKAKDIHAGDFWVISPRSPVLVYGPWFFTKQLIGTALFSRDHNFD